MIESQNPQQLGHAGLLRGKQRGKLNYYRLKPVGWGEIVATD